MRLSLFLKYSSGPDPLQKGCCSLGIGSVFGYEETGCNGISTKEWNDSDSNQLIINNVI